MMQLLQELQATLFHEIPLTRFIGITVTSYTDGILTLSAPLEKNINHKQTAFAGSLNAVATLAGWSQVWLLLKELEIPGKVVIQDNNTIYHKPVQGDFTAQCARPTSAKIEQLARTMRKKGKARIELQAEIYSGPELAVTFNGRYVILSA